MPRVSSTSASSGMRKELMKALLLWKRLKRMELLLAWIRRHAIQVWRVSKRLPAAAAAATTDAAATAAAEKLACRALPLIVHRPRLRIVRERRKPAFIRHRGLQQAGQRRGAQAMMNRSLWAATAPRQQELTVLLGNSP